MLRVSCIFVADGAKTELRLRLALSGSCFAVTGKRGGFARSGALGPPGAGHGLAGGREPNNHSPSLYLPDGAPRLTKKVIRLCNSNLEAIHTAWSKISGDGVSCLSSALRSLHKPGKIPVRKIL